MVDSHTLQLHTLSLLLIFGLAVLLGASGCGAPAPASPTDNSTSYGTSPPPAEASRPGATDTAPPVDKAAQPSGEDPLGTNRVEQGQGLVTGTVYWPDGRPASNVELLVYPSGVGPSGGISDISALEAVTSDSGQYAVEGCPCAFSIWFFEDTVLGATSPFNGGRACYILFQHGGQVDDVQAIPGEVLDWKMEDMPCASTYFNPGGYQATLTDLLQAQSNAITGIGDTSYYAGPWQAARMRLG
ncbi:hypothetical protein [Sinomonas sp. RB5]